MVTIYDRNGILFCFYQDRTYYLKENEEDYSWELHCEKVR